MFCRAIRPPAFQIDDNVVTLTASTASEVVKTIRTVRGRELADAGRAGDEDAVLAAVTGTLNDLRAAEAAIETTRETLADIKAAIAALDHGELPATGALPDLVAAAADAFGVVQRICEGHPDAALVTLRRDALGALRDAETKLAEGLKVAEARFDRAKDLRVLAAKIGFSFSDLQRALTLGLKRHLADNPAWASILGEIGKTASDEIQQRLRDLRAREIEAQRRAKAAAKHQLNQSELWMDLRRIHSEDRE